MLQEGSEQTSDQADAQQYGRTNDDDVTHNLPYSGVAPHFGCVVQARKGDVCENLEVISH